MACKYAGISLVTEMGVCQETASLLGPTFPSGRGLNPPRRNIILETLHLLETSLGVTHCYKMHPGILTRRCERILAHTITAI